MSKKINKKENIMSKKINKKENITPVKNIIIFFLVGVIVILGGILVFSTTRNNPSSAIQNNSTTQNNLSSATTQNNAGPQPKILVSEEKWDFGKVTQGEKPSHIFMVKNGGERDLIIDSLKGSCACIEASISATLIKPGESAELKVSYDTTDYVGKDEKHLHIYSNDPQVPDKYIGLYVETEVFQIPNIVPNLTPNLQN
ncbi:MAG: DUF1573 domain-containing protein [Candidatus Atribacteria bacterium]|nr:MAG: DUF1573 domain-containing protein [Candidatus Atribacteria bacterium]